jgi:hypothetical protein
MANFQYLKMFIYFYYDFGICLVFWPANHESLHQISRMDRKFSLVWQVTGNFFNFVSDFHAKEGFIFENTTLAMV